MDQLPTLASQPWDTGYFVFKEHNHVHYKDFSGGVNLCNPPLPSFAAGTTDGQGDLNFIQGITKGNVLWDSVKGLLGPPSAEQKVTLSIFIYI